MTSISKLRFGKELSQLTVNDIQLLINNKIDESQNLDYKQPSGDPHIDCNNIAIVISSFLNTAGGIIIYGVAESKEGEHRLASKIMWSKLPKETVENLLISKVQPWSQQTRIQRIVNQENTLEGIYVVDVPRSTNPPHMYLPSNVYYQRLNFQNRPMDHESIFRAFQTSSIRRRDIIKQVIEPLYSEIKINFESIRDYKQTLRRNKYDSVIENERFLYDLIEISDRKKIDEFYNRLENYQALMFQIYKCTTRLINEQLSKYDVTVKFYPNIEQDNFGITLYLRDASGNTTQAEGISIREALLKRKPLKKYLQSLYPLEEIGAIIPYIGEHANTFPQSELKDFWTGCKLAVKQNKYYILIWKERAELLELCKNILKELAS